MIRALPAIIVCLAVASSPALARTATAAKPNKAPAPAAHGAGKKRAAGKPAETKPTGAVANAYAAMPPLQRLAIQADLAWIGDYEGLPSGDVDGRFIDAIKLFQKNHGGKETGILDEPQRAQLAAIAAGPQQAAGWELIDDPATGARFGLPAKLVGARSAALTGSRWVSGRGQIQIETFRFGEASLPALFEEQKKTGKRYVEASALKPNSFAIAGTQGLKNFVVRAQASGSEVRGISIRYDQANAGIMMPVAIAMADSFDGFPDPNGGPPPGRRRAVEYGTAIVADRHGDLVAPLQVTADCEAITVPGFGHAVRIAQDKSEKLALLRLYGARNLVPAPLAGADAQGDTLTLVGIADPLAQQGGAAVGKAAARRNGQGVEPVPPYGFSGAAAVDPQGRFAGLVALDIAVVAGIAPASPQALLIPAAAVRAFLTAHGIAPAAGHEAIDQSVLRVICVRR